MKPKSISLLIILVALSCVIFGVLIYVPDYQLRTSFTNLFSLFTSTVKTIILILGLGVVLVVLAGVLWLMSIAYASGVVWHSLARSKRAEALKLEREAVLVITTAPPGSQVYASELVGKIRIEHKPLYLASGTVGHQPLDPDLDEIKRWSFFQLTQNISKRPEIAVEEIQQLQPPLPHHVDLQHYVTSTPSLRTIFLGVGRLPNGVIQPISAPLSRLVHIAVAGSSGFGKSTLMQALGYQIVNAREHVSTVMLDAQGVTFTPFEGNQNLSYPIASEPEDIKAILGELLSEMDKRKDLYSRWRGIDHLDKYNRVVSEAEHLPTISIFFDEFGLLADDKELVKYVKKLSQAGRKFGIYLIAGSQTWYSNEVASSLKANLSTTIQFYASSKSQSRILLGDSAASDITRPGQAFCRLPGQPGLVEIQAPDANSMLDVNPGLVKVERSSEASMPKLQPNDWEQKILDLYDQQVQQDQINKAEISIKVFGSKGGNQYKKINQVLDKFGRV